MPRNSKRIYNKKNNIVLGDDEVKLLPEESTMGKSKTPNKRNKQTDEGVTEGTPLSTEKVKRTKFTNERPKETYEDKNKNHNASMVKEVQQVSEKNKVQKEGRSEEILQLEPNDDDFPAENSVVKQKRVRSANKMDNSTAKRRKGQEQTSTDINARLSEQMEKLVQELAQVKEQLRDKQGQSSRDNGSKEKTGGIPIVKSPSVDTIYVPAVKKINDIPTGGVVVARINGQEDQLTTPEFNKRDVVEGRKQQFENQLNKFLAQIR